MLGLGLGIGLANPNPNPNPNQAKEAVELVPGDDEGLARLERHDARGARAHLEDAELAWSGARG